MFGAARVVAAGGGGCMQQQWNAAAVLETISNTYSYDAWYSIY